MNIKPTLTIVVENKFESHTRTLEKVVGNISTTQGFVLITYNDKTTKHPCDKPINIPLNVRSMHNYITINPCDASGTIIGDFRHVNFKNNNLVFANFSPSPQLETIDLSHNRLHSFYLPTVANARRINLENNAITYLDFTHTDIEPTNQPGFAYLEELFVKGNFIPTLILSQCKKLRRITVEGYDPNNKVDVSIIHPKPISSIIDQ